jgi:hypothetical protein
VSWPQQEGVSRSCSRDHKNWTFVGSANGDENVSVVVSGNEDMLFHSQGNGVGVKRCFDLKNREDVVALITSPALVWHGATTCKPGSGRERRSDVCRAVFDELGGLEAAGCAATGARVSRLLPLALPIGATLRL